VKIFQKILPRFVWPSNRNKPWKNFFLNNPKWRSKTTWPLSAAKVVKISSKSSVKQFSFKKIFQRFYFQERKNSNKKSVMATKIQNGGRKSKWRQMDIFLLNIRLVRHLPGKLRTLWMQNIEH
jgi:hypothetical protein